MANLSCAFFGHRDFCYQSYEDKIRERVVDLINRGVTTFYNGFRGNFDRLCARIVSDLKVEYPHIQNILVVSYLSTKKIDVPDYFDGTVHFLDKKVPFRFAIVQTNRRLVETVDYIVSGVTRSYGGAKSACDYAKQLYRTIFYIVNDYSYCDYDWVLNGCEEKHG